MPSGRDQRSFEVSRFPSAVIPGIPNGSRRLPIDVDLIEPVSLKTLA
jgi:hypothetical protein